MEVLTPGVILLVKKTMMDDAVADRDAELAMLMALSGGTVEEASFALEECRGATLTKRRSSATFLLLCIIVPMETIG